MEEKIKKILDSSDPDQIKKVKNFAIEFHRGVLSEECGKSWKHYSVKNFVMHGLHFLIGRHKGLGNYYDKIWTSIKSNDPDLLKIEILKANIS